MSEPCIRLIALIACAYLIGAIPWGLIVVRHLKKIDVRTVGSGNIGATNVRRAAGTPAALLVLLLDLLKGALPVLALRHLDPDCGLSWQASASLAMVAAIAGHMYPIYLKFRPSGKGVATALGCCLVLAPWAALSALLTYIIVAAVSRKSSLGSLAGALVLPAVLWATTCDGMLTAGVLISVGLIVLRHRENIRRLLNGSEPSLK